MQYFDVIIIGAGGAGMMCANQAGLRGRKVLLLDHSKKVGGKILISGGGRCNFTNTGASPAQYVSENPHFCKSALSRYPSQKFIELVESHSIPFHEKKLGQLFCDHSAQNIVDLLIEECSRAGAQMTLNSQVKKVFKENDSFCVITNSETFSCSSLVIATGGLSIPKLGATGFGYQIAKQFGLNLIPTRAALDGFTLSAQDSKYFGDLAGLSVDVLLTTSDISFRENILFTHAGLSGPATLQASLHWKPGSAVYFNFIPDISFAEWIITKKKENNRSYLKNVLAELIPSRLAERLCEIHFQEALPLPQISDQDLKDFAEKLHHWQMIPAGTVGYSKAEVTRGGVDTNELSSKTMESKKVPGLYFIGEVIDVTGWLGGYNFQWAWASGWAAGQVV